MSGFIKIHRTILESSTYKQLNSSQRDVMFTCLLMVNWKENEWLWNGEMFKCKPGQMITSLQSIAKNCGKNVKVQSVRTALLKLEKMQFLTNESTKSGRLITICKWDSYQSKDEITNKDTNKELTKNQQRANKELTTIEEGKESKEGKKVKNTLMSEANASDLTENNFHYFKISKGFYDLFKRNSSEVLKVNWKHLEKAKANSFTDNIRLAIEQDKRTEDDMRDVYHFLKTDDFWMKNIQSSKSLRDNFDQLITKARNPSKKNKSNESEKIVYKGILSNVSRE